MCNRVGQGGKIFFMPWAKNSFPVGTNAQETPPATDLEK
jgi:hypothetical protein